VSEFGDPQIKSEELKHFHPTGAPSDVTPYLTEAGILFTALELVPGQRAYFRLAKNFAIYYSEMRSPTEAH
jgi:hypothetical protein